MYKKSEVEFERYKIAKVTRALTRLKHSINADEELNDVLPDRLAAFDAALQQGEIKAIDTYEALDIGNWESNVKD